MDSPLLPAAIDYLSRGLPVLALNGKRPNTAIHRHWLEDAIVPEWGPEAIAHALTHPKTTGIGISIPYPYVVVDIDSEVGAQNWQNLVGDEFIPDRWVAKTAHGLHLWYASVEPTGSFKPFGPDGGVDLKGQKSYVAAPPSWHPGYPDEGMAPGYHYQWLLEPSDLPPMDAPDALNMLIATHNFDVERKIVGRTKRKRVRHQPFEDQRLWASFGFEHIYERMKAEPSGNRNNLLLWAAAVLEEEGATPEEFEMLRATVPDLGYAARRTIASGRKRAGG